MSYEIPASTFHVVFEDGREFKVETDQRDQRRGFLIAKVDPEPTPSAACAPSPGPPSPACTSSRA